MNEKLKGSAAEIRQKMVTAVLLAACEFPGFGYEESYADGTWSIEVSPDGVVKNGGYAEEFRGPSSNINELSTSELGRLVQEIEQRIAPKPVWTGR